MNHSHHLKTPMTYQQINSSIERINCQAQAIAKASPEQYGKQMEQAARFICIRVAIICAITLKAAELVYQAGYAFGQKIHWLNDYLTMATAHRNVRKSTHSQLFTDPQNPWQLQLPLPQVLRNLIGDWHASTSVTTRTISSLKTKNQPLSSGTKRINVTADQKRAVGTMSKDGPSKASVSSPRSKPSVKRSTSTRKPSKMQEKNVTISDGTHSVSTTEQSGHNRIQR